ncbi:MarR family transcriptional regulator [Kocuria sp. CPCC 205258]|uniref:MarR family winged helix-turn-helix transcriptional regulator n=1 Tax=Kocuria TaxID=57493 RepID=UPI0009DE9FC6|nr:MULTISPECIES: MarR family transcriptional regulator [Kocuria]MEB2525774.1 MarR family transcriptional regulator [Kocuria rosea]MEB2618393.1 MarR family transcriptional regulator [Kocuria rosea]STX06805.1 Staphylococcal accessory regulator Z [Kocuria rosea]
MTGRPAAAPEPTAAPEPAARPWDVWQLFFETTARLTTEIEARLKEHGCSLMDYQVLLLLRNAEDHRLRMGELAQRLVFSPSRLSYQIGVLEKRGWVRRRRCAEDARGLEAELTEEGLRAFRRLRPAHARDVEELFLRALEGDDADRLAAVMDRLARRLA